MSSDISSPAVGPRKASLTRRFLLAGIIVGLVLVALAISSVLDYLTLDRIPGRTAIFGLPTIVLTAGATWVGIRAFEQEAVRRRRYRLWAAALTGLAILLWLFILNLFTFAADVGPRVALTSTLACLPTTAFGLWVVRHLARSQKEPWRIVLVAAAWGAVVATSLVIWAETVSEYWTFRLLVPGPGLDASTAFSAGLFEELAKGLAVLLLFLVMRDRFNGVVDGIVYGAAVGLGFNFMETIGYMTYLYSLFGPSAAEFQWYHRQVLDLFFGHAAYTALIGAGIGIASQLPDRGQQVLAITCGWLGAIAGHFAWDAWLTFFPLGAGLQTLVQVHLRVLLMNGPVVVGVVLLLVMGMRLESRALERQLRLEAETGLGAVLAWEVPILRRPLPRFAYRLQALARGPVAYARAGRLQRAQLQLALERWDRERQEIDSPREAEAELRAQAIALRR